VQLLAGRDQSLITARTSEVTHTAHPSMVCYHPAMKQTVTEVRLVVSPLLRAMAGGSLGVLYVRTLSHGSERPALLPMSGG
jgi:hypothetical protein